MAGIRYWVWLAALRGMRSTAYRLVLDHFGGPMETYFAPAGAYGEIPELTARERAALENKDLAETEKILEICTRESIRILTRQDADYPARLAEIYDAPPVLYLRGRLPFVDELPAIALVGTRNASVYGVKMGTRLGCDLTSAGACVLSGLALGVDAAAARGALLAGGGCIGVLGSAIDNDYPRANASLIADVAAAGAVLSEFPPGYPTLPENFPRRNRILSGLAVGVCVVEAPARSGALITADLALEQGRDLFAVPGNADNPGCAGSNRLLRDCAKAVTCAEDILCEYTGLFPGRIKPAAAPPCPLERPAAETDRDKSGIDKAAAIPYIDLESRWKDFSEEQRKILRLLAAGRTQVDDLIAETELGSPRVLSELTVLSIRGAVRAQPGGRYSLNLE